MMRPILTFLFLLLAAAIVGIVDNWKLAHALEVTHGPSSSFTPEENLEMGKQFLEKSKGRQNELNRDLEFFGKACFPKMWNERSYAPAFLSYVKRMETYAKESGDILSRPAHGAAANPRIYVEKSISICQGPFDEVLAELSKAQDLLQRHRSRLEALKVALEKDRSAAIRMLNAIARYPVHEKRSSICQSRLSYERAAKRATLAGDQSNMRSRPRTSDSGFGYALLGINHGVQYFQQLENRILDMLIKLEKRRCMCLSKESDTKRELRALNLVKSSVFQK